jgi:hypothetical protein
MVALASLLAGCSALRHPGPPPEERRAIVRDAYVYAFPMLAAYKALYQFTLDPRSGQYKGPFNQVVSEARVFDPDDTTVATPNVDTGYSWLAMDLRAEPLVLCVPDVDPGRWFSVQVVDLYTFVDGYLGTRATGNQAGCWLVAGPGWQGATPPGVGGVLRSETVIAFAIYRTQLFGRADVENVRRIQAGYRVQPLSAFVGAPPPPAPRAIVWPRFTDAAFRADFAAYLNFLLLLAPPAPEDAALRARFASVGIAPGKPFDVTRLPAAEKLAVGQGVQDGYAAIEAKQPQVGTSANGWWTATAFGDRAFYRGDHLLRAAAARVALFGNVPSEALYPVTAVDAEGVPLDGNHHRYRLRFAPGALPPAHAFWTLTVYDARTQLLVANPIDRYVLGSATLPRGRDRGLTIALQKDAPDGDDPATWLPAPDGPTMLVLRLYWPEAAALDGSWKPPRIERID